MWWEGGWIWYSREFGLCSFPPPTAHMGLLPLKWWVRGGSSLLPPSTHRRCVNPPNTCVGPTCAMGRVRFPHSYKLISSSLPPSPSFMFIAVVTTMWQSSVLSRNDCFFLVANDSPPHIWFICENVENLVIVNCTAELMRSMDRRKWSRSGGKFYWNSISSQCFWQCLEKENVV